MYAAVMQRIHGASQRGDTFLVTRQDLIRCSLGCHRSTLIQRTKPFDYDADCITTDFVRVFAVAAECASRVFASSRLLAILPGRRGMFDNLNKRI